MSSTSHAIARTSSSMISSSAFGPALLREARSEAFSALSRATSSALRALDSAASLMRACPAASSLMSKSVRDSWCASFLFRSAFCAAHGRSEADRITNMQRPVRLSDEALARSTSGTRAHLSF
eukprot:2249459-Prymnesium_polylepis.1